MADGLLLTDRGRSKLIDIAITGANGAVGTALIQYLSEGPAQPAPCLRALVRSRERARSLRPLGAEIIEVDYRRLESLRKAVEGAEAIVHLAGALLPRRGETLLDANLEATGVVVKASSLSGVKTFVYLSYPGADLGSPNRYLSSKGMAEEVIRRSGFSGVIFRVPMILGRGSASMEKLRQMAAAPFVPLVGGGSVRIQPISQADVVAAIAWAVTAAPKPMRVMDLVGPETLTYAELLRRVGQRLGKRPRMFRIPKGTARLSAWLTGCLVPSLGWNPSVFDTLFNEHLADPSEARATLPFELTSVNAVLDQAISAVD
jgi:uncharacterized protein YbjT (DUF2867 family)